MCECESVQKVLDSQRTGVCGSAQPAQALEQFQCPYRVRRSRRARRLSLMVDAYGCIDLVIPWFCAYGDAVLFIQQHQSWVTRQLDQHTARRREDPALYSLLPEYVELKALNNRWRVHHLAAAPARLREHENTLHIQSQDQSKTVALLQRWLHSKARPYFESLLRECAAEMQVNYAGFSVRRQKTRWGSCTSAKHINLNQNAMFLTPECVRYLCIHELCHTVFLNHSSRFWRMVNTYEPRFREFEQYMNQSGSIPYWAQKRNEHVDIRIRRNSLLPE